MTILKIVLCFSGSFERVDFLCSTDEGELSWAKIYWERFRRYLKINTDVIVVLINNRVKIEQWKQNPGVNYKKTIQPCPIPRKQSFADKIMPTASQMVILCKINFNESISSVVVSNHYEQQM